MLEASISKAIKQENNTEQLSKKTKQSLAEIGNVLKMNKDKQKYS